MEGKLTDWQNGIISEVLAKMVSGIYSNDALTAAREGLTAEFLALNSQTDFQGIPSEIPPEWLDASAQESVRRVVDLHCRRRIFD